MPLKCWSQCDAITAICSIRFDRKVAICMKFVTHCWLLKEYSCSEDWDLSRFRRTSRNPCCSTRAISLSRCWPSIERTPPTLGSRCEAVDVAAKRSSGFGNCCGADHRLTGLDCSHMRFQSVSRKESGRHPQPDQIWDKATLSVSDCIPHFPARPRHPAPGADCRRHRRTSPPC